MSVPTPHIASEKGHIAKTVLMPGDPLRAKFIADTFLTDAVLVNNVRGVQGHTGTWKGVPVTVMASGMGIPAIGIYSWELFNFYDVDNIIRIGSAGALQDDIKVMDIVAAQGACTNSNYINQFNCPGTFAPIADYTLLSKAVEARTSTELISRSATSSRTTPSMPPRARTMLTAGGAWALSPSRWRPPGSTPTPPTPTSALCASARSPIISTVPRPSPPSSARPPSPR